MINIVVNGNKESVEQELTVNQLLEHLNIKAKMIVVELNRSIVNKEDYDKTTIKEDDTVEIVQFVGGG